MSLHEQQHNEQNFLPLGPYTCNVKVAYTAIADSLEDYTSGGVKRIG